MKILYKDSIDKILSNVIVCSYCGCEFLLTNKEKEVNKEQLLHNIVKDNGGSTKYMVFDSYTTTCPNCNREVHIADSKARIIKERKW